MIDLECPNCGRVGSVPREKANSRLVCKKCNSIFHMGPTGRAVLGEPPAPRKADHGHAHASPTVPTVLATLKETGQALPVVGEWNVGLIGVLVALLVVGAAYLGYSMIGGRASTALYPIAQRMADAIKTDDFNTIKELTGSESAGDVANWYENAKRTVEEMKKGATGRDPQVMAVADENTSQGTGQVDFFIIPSRGVARNVEIAKEAGTSAKSVQLTTFWTLSGGKWQFEARKSMGGG